MLSVTGNVFALCVLFLAFFGQVLVSATTCAVGFAPCGDACYDPGSGLSCCDNVSTSYVCNASSLGHISDTVHVYTTRTALLSTTATLSLDIATSVGNPAIGATASVSASGVVNTAPVASSGHTSTAAVPSTPVAGALTSAVGTCGLATTTVYSVSTATVTPGSSWLHSYSAGNATTGTQSNSTTAKNSTDTAPSASVTTPSGIVPSGPTTPIPSSTTATSVAGTSVPSTSGGGSTTAPVPSYDPTNAGIKPVASALLSVVAIAVGMMMI